MIRWTRTARVAPGKLPDAIHWAKEMREYTKTKFGGATEVKIYLERYGELGVICWMADFENLATLELAGHAIDSDTGYQDRLKVAGELFLPGAFDKLYLSVD